MTVREQAQTFEIPRLDYVLLSVVVMLLLIGLLMIWSITLPINAENGTDPFAHVVKQTLFAAIGLVFLLLGMQIDYHQWDRWAMLMFGITIPVLGVLLFTDPVFGSKRWFNLLGEGTIQPAEVAKFTFIVYIAKWLSSKGSKLRELTYGLIPFALLVGFVDGLIVLQPNLSTAIIIGLCAVTMFFIAGADVIQFLLLIIAGGVAIFFVVTRIAYLSDRFASFGIDPFAATGSGAYHVVQMVIYLGSGGFFGRGIGMGIGKFGFVPTPQTDSIFALLGEEFGLVGTWGVLALYLALAYRGFRIATRAADPFGQLLATGITVWLTVQAFANIGVTTGSLPPTGVPLPFISYGGSALIAALGAVGVLLNISRNAGETREENASFDFGWRNGGARLSRVSRRERTARQRGE